jgi:cell wall-associated NlpC family hydrolase
LPHGRDRNGWDCWGLLRVVYQEQFGVILPSLSGEYADGSDFNAISLLYLEEVEQWHEVSEPRAGDAVWMTILGHPCHVGVYVDGDRLLHVMFRSGTRIDRINSPAWNRRIRAYYRHRLLIP